MGPIAFGLAVQPPTMVPSKNANENFFPKNYCRTKVYIARYRQQPLFLILKAYIQLPEVKSFNITSNTQSVLCAYLVYKRPFS